MWHTLWTGGCINIHTLRVTASMWKDGIRSCDRRERTLTARSRWEKAEARPAGPPVYTPRLSEHTRSSLGTPAGLHTQEDKHTHTHVDSKIRKAYSWNTYSIRSASPGPRDRGSEATGRTNPPTRRYRLQTQTSRKKLQRDRPGNRRPGLSLECERVNGNSGEVKGTLLCLPWVSIKKRRQLSTESSLHFSASPASSCWSDSSDVRRLQRLTCRRRWPPDRTCPQLLCNMKLIHTSVGKSVTYTHLDGVCMCWLHTSWPEPTWNTQTTVTRGDKGIFVPFSPLSPMTPILQADITVVNDWNRAEI